MFIAYITCMYCQGLLTIIPSLAGPAKIGAAVGHKVHELEVQELEIQEMEVQ